MTKLKPKEKYLRCLYRMVLTESELDLGVLAPVDGPYTCTVRVYVKVLHHPLHKVQDDREPLTPDAARRVDQEGHVQLSGTSCENNSK